jgi:hypothetical protein
MLGVFFLSTLQRYCMPYQLTYKIFELIVRYTMLVHVYFLESIIAFDRFPPARRNAALYQSAVSDPDLVREGGTEIKL